MTPCGARTRTDWVAASEGGHGEWFLKRHGVTRLVWFEGHPLSANAIQRETSIKHRTMAGLDPATVNSLRDPFPDWTVNRRAVRTVLLICGLIRNAWFRGI